MSLVRRILVIALLLSVISCSHIPTEGPVTEVTISDDGRGVQIAPEPPREGMSPARIVEGFLQAMADPVGNYAVARQYLSKEAQDSWSPGQGAVVYEGWVQQPDLVLRGEQRGIIDGVGRYSVADEQLEHDFGLIQEQGQWRISTPPDRVLISGYMFARAYSTAKSYFVANQGQAVIADVLHIPHSELTPARIIAAQLAGPSQALSGAVRSAIPDGVSLGPAGANVDAAGLVTVDLAGLDEDLGDDARRELGAQLLWSMSAISRVTALQITVDGKIYPLPGQNEQQQLELSSQQGFQPLSRAGSASLYGVQGSRAGQLNTEDEFVTIGADATAVEMTAVSLDGTLIATTTGSPVQLRIGPLGGEPVVVDTGLVAANSLQFAHNRVWLQGQAADGQSRVLSVSSQGGIATVDVTNLPGQLLEFSLDAAGVRMAAILERDGTRIFGTAVVNQNYQVTGWREVKLNHPASVTLDGFTALDWTGELDVALIANGASSSSVYVARVDGSQVDDLGPVFVDPVAITALPRPGGDALAVRTAENSVLLYQPNDTWRIATATMSWISYPG